ncbi:MAG: lysophospholipid acyltransferase family protein [Alphaproteobacteria bacterium]|jgi:1-acyl-sn-glycerol-3-phosphate acyltransferase|nr:lysophospholipid acyltransferase family protein [Alphaproteobacteria bacterium]MDP6518041.1 lysophospholipid acyltransferase family protein [Alphaproteobacteria bacterium]|tara:strand:+ start:169 stop:1023 length:855 start_codon:yes stop_codon:yes gene_type:complete
MAVALHCRALLRAILATGWTLSLLPAQYVALRMGWRASWTIPRLYHRGNCRIMGLRLVCRGVPADPGPVLYICNHASYLDIVVLAALLRASFVAKSEVAKWPVLGLLAKLNRTVFVERRAVRSHHHRDQMQQRLDAGESLILFPEGTSSDGNRVLRFNSTFFSIAEKGEEGAKPTVQPVSIAYTELNGLPMGRRLRPYFAWYGDMELAGHLWTMLGLGTVTVEVTFHPPVTMEGLSSRKALARHCRAAVARGVSDMLSGRDPLAEAPPPHFPGAPRLPNRHGDD